jgi:ParB-like chromosome segregation protein Spo0J
VVIIGHGRLLATQKLGMEKVPVLKMENLTETQIKKLRILDNKLNESERDEENLKLELEQLDNDLSI